MEEKVDNSTTPVENKAMKQLLTVNAQTANVNVARSNLEKYLELRIITMEIDRLSRKGEDRYRAHFPLEQIGDAFDGDKLYIEPAIVSVITKHFKSLGFEVKTEKVGLQKSVNVWIYW